MLKVPTYLAPSSIHGMGIFTPLAIDEGAVVWDFTPGIDAYFTEEELSAFPEPYQSRVRTYCYQEDSGLYVLCGDNARFMNHSFEPNCDDSGSCTVARRPIEAGEELTCDYRQFDLPSRLEGLAEFREAG